MKRGQIRRLAAACGVHESDVVRAVQKGRLEVDRLVEGAFDAAGRAKEEALGDAALARLGIDPSPTSARRVYADAEESLSDAWLARQGRKKID